MNSFQTGVIDLVKSAITGEKAVIKSDFDWKNALRLAQIQQILPLIYYGIKNSQITLDSETENKLENYTIKTIMATSVQNNAINNVFKIFRENNIDFLPLKGSVIRRFYKKAEMRLMGDVDILVKEEAYEKIRTLLEENGYLPLFETDPEFVWEKKNELHLEIHKSLFSKTNKVFYDYFGTGWERAQKTDSSEYKMSLEDVYIYLFTHFAKHFKGSGVGIRHLVDFYVLKRENENLNFSYIEEQLKKMELQEFHGFIQKTLDVWFFEARGDEKTDFITSRVFSGGAFGNEENFVLSQGARYSERKSGAKLGLFFSATFPRLNIMKSKYPILNKAPILLPFLWVFRIITAILFRGKNIKDGTKKVKMMSDENINEYKKSLELVGLKMD